MAKMIDCPYCGKLTDPNLSNCPHCGGSLAHRNVVPKRANLGRGRQTCPSCKALVADGDIICVACGTNLLTGQKVINEPEPEEEGGFQLPSIRTLAIAAGALVVAGLIAVWGYYLTRDPKSQAARLIEDGSYIEAMEVLQAYVADAPDDSEARIILGQLQYRNNRLGDAATSFEDALRLHPTDIRAAYWALACVIRAGGDETFARRRQLLEKIVQMDPAQDRAWYLLALARGATGDKPGQARALEQYLGAGGDREIYDWNQGLILAESGDLDAGTRALEAAQTGTRAADGKAALAMIAAQRGEIAAAQIALEEALTAEGLTITWEAQTELGKLYVARGDFARAVTTLDAALAANPAAPSARFFRGIAQAATNREQQALLDFDYLINAGREYAYEASLEAARIHLSRNDTGRALDFLNRANRFGTATADALLLQGRAAARQGNQREAEKNFSLAIEADATLAEAHLERGLAYIQLERIEAGISDLQRYVELVGSDMQGTEVVEIRELISQLRRSVDGTATSAVLQPEDVG